MLDVKVKSVLPRISNQISRWVEEEVHRSGKEAQEKWTKHIADELSLPADAISSAVSLSKMGKTVEVVVDSDLSASLSTHRKGHSLALQAFKPARVKRGTVCKSRTIEWLSSMLF